MTERIEEDPQILCTAVKNGNLKIVEDLLKDGADVNTIDGTYQIECVTLLHSALHREQVEMVKLLIQYGADLNVKDSRRRSPIDIAKESWNPEFKELLLINGAVVRKDNALHAAVNSGNLEIVEELLKDGVDVSIIEDSDLIIGKTVLHRAVCTRQLEITKLLITYGADVNLKDCWGKTPLAEAFQIKHTEMWYPQ
ncbi:ankyrin repeat and SOCS box protein 6-like isoform X2 [Lasioglossum baleicum]|uniref:ankyrin repeat and SOCS box protein 6-like isoform X2 n=1 Tax=Lasioglossum baleicum TaxID=434251 RepID=UPI003FCD91AE